MIVKKVTKKGQIVIPKVFRMHLGINENTDLSVSLSPDGASISIRPVRVDVTPISNALDVDRGLREKVADAIERSEEGEFLDSEQSLRFLNDKNNF
jgi:AbrB family looped-hinge helix DNA binding protein